MTEIKKNRGRPPTDDPMIRMPDMKVRKEQLKAYKSAAEKEGKTFSAWVREALDDKVSND